LSPSSREPDRSADAAVIEDLREGNGEALTVPDGDALRYDTQVDLSNTNTTHAKLVQLTGTGTRILEVGPATGYLTRILHDRGCTVTGIEIDPVAARNAARYAERMIVGDVEALDFEDVFGDQRFEVVMYGDVLEHLVDPTAVLRKTASVLEPGGAVVASIPNIAHGSVRLGLLAGHFKYTPEGLLDRSHVRFFTRETVERLFLEAGFTVTDWDRTTADLFATELALSEEEFPAALLDSVRSLPDWDTYQFVVRARPEVDGALQRPSSEPERGSGWRRIFEPIWDAEERVQTQQAHLEKLETQVAEEEQRGDRKSRELAARDELIQALNRRVEEIHQIAQLRDRQIAEANRSAIEAREELTRIQQSRGYRLFARTARLLRRLFPAGTLRGRFYRWLKSPIPRREGPQSPAPSETEHAESQSVAEAEAGYERWIERNEPDAEELDRQRIHARRLIRRPLMSVVAVAKHPDPESFRRTRASLEDQTYDRWELCLVPVEPLSELRGLLHEWDRDPRIKTDALVGESAERAVNRAVEMAQGDFVVLLGLGDSLASSALYRLAVALNRDPRIEMAYSDGDILGADGQRRDPQFTPEWSPETLVSAEYARGLLAFRRSFLSDLGGLSEDLGDAAQWDLLLRAAERTDRVLRVPQVLRHRQPEPHRPESIPAEGQRAVQEHLERQGKRASVERTEDGSIRVRWKLERPPNVSIIIPTRHNRRLLERCLRGIVASGYEPREVIVVETAGRSEDREAWYRRIAAEVPLRVLWWDRPFNYSAVNQWASQEANGEVLLFLNDDIEPITSEWIDELVGWAMQDEIGVVGAQLVGPDDRIQHAGAVIGLNGFADHLFRGMRSNEWSLLGSTMWYRNVTAVTAACMAMRREVLEKVGGWDDRFELMGSDVELCLRVGRAGHRTLCTPFARLRHLEAATRGARIPKQDFFISFWHYQNYLNAGDPYFNPNLSYRQGRPTLRAVGERHSLDLVSDVIRRDLRPFRQGARTDEPMWFAEMCRLLPGELEETRRIQEANRGPLEVRTINWFIPDFDSPFYGGIHTVFRFADHFKRRYGVENRFIVMGTGPEEFVRSGLQVTFPDIADSPIVISPLAERSDLEVIPPSDASVATLWVTAYAVSKFNQTKRKFYFIQDFEPMFYPAGTMYALAEESYRLGLYGLTNTSTLSDIYASQYEGIATAFTPSVDAMFHPNGRPTKGDPYTVFLYARPGHWRNCYELAISALTRLNETLGDRVRIVTAGSWARGQSEELEYFVDHQGLLEYEQTAELYRNCDAGLALTVSKHPSYLPMQLMASGALVVSNRNPAGSWLLRDGENCLLADATADRLHQALLRGLTDEDLRQKLTSQARADIDARHRDWEAEIDRVFDFMSNPQS
jgi:O-antigen biosynthesis protein